MSLHHHRTFRMSPQRFFSGEFKNLSLFLATWIGVNGLALTRASAGEIPSIDPLVEQAIRAGEMPGAVVLIGRDNDMLHFKAYGQRQVLPDAERMTTDTIFDIASLSKPISTATCIMVLVQQGKIDPFAPVAAAIPEFTGQGKELITVHHLLTHTSGLIADNPLSDYQDGKSTAWKQICQLPLIAAPGEKFIYSDVGFIVLGRLVETVANQPLNEFASRTIFQPLRMQDTDYLPRPDLQPRIAPSDMQEGTWLRGTVHDPRARALGGVAGHAGVFSTASDLSRYARMILNQGELDGVQILQPESVKAMLTSRPIVNQGIRTWGWDRSTAYSKNRGEGMSETAIGHGGFTGTGLWIDPELHLYVIFLSNRLHPDGKGAVNQLIGKVGTEAVKAVQARK